MNFNYSRKSGWIEDETYRQFGHFDKSETKTGNAVMIDLQFRMATNGVIVNTLVNDEPLMTTSAGLFR
jgi:hypothetical protein